MIRVDDYDPSWVDLFEQLRTTYESALDSAGVPYLAVEHVGSTSVPGLAAKPIIDVDIVVTDRDVDAASRALVGLGFVPRGELSIPQRWAFQAPGTLPRTHTYVVVDGSLGLRNHLAVRDLLRTDAALREEYAAAKRAAAATTDDSDLYVARKNAMVQRLLTAAGLTADERSVIDAQQAPATGRD